MEILSFALFAEVRKVKKTKKQKIQTATAGSSEELSDDDAIIPAASSTIESEVLSTQLSRLNTSDTVAVEDATMEQTNASLGRPSALEAANVLASLNITSSEAHVSQNSLSDGERHDQLLEQLNIVRNSLGMLGSDDQMMPVGSAIDAINALLPTNMAFDEAEFIERIRSVDSIYYHEEEHQIIFM